MKAKKVLISRLDDSDSDDCELNLLKNIDAFLGTYFEYKFGSNVYRLPKVLVNRYVLSKELNHGCFGSVFDVYDT